MKRSEMIALLQDAIIDEHDNDIYISQETCSRILNRLEKAGMQPPPYIRQDSIDKTTIYATLIDDNSWEPEDDDSDNYCGAV